jgi:hypothetical protein
MCNRPRTQRIGKDAYPREILIKRFDNLKEAQKLKRELKRAHKKMVSKGYPWPGGKVGEFQIQPNDTFYIARYWK